MYNIITIHITHQLIDYKITFVNSKHKNTNSKDDFVLKNHLRQKFKKFAKPNLSQKYILFYITGQFYFVAVP